MSLLNLVSLLFVGRWTLFFFLFVRSFFLRFRLVFVFLITFLFLFFSYSLHNINLLFCLRFIYFSFSWIWFWIVVLFIINIILIIVPIMRIPILIVVIIIILLIKSLLLFFLLPTILLRFASSLIKSNKIWWKMKRNLPVHYLSITDCCISIVIYFDYDNLLDNHQFPNSRLHLILIL